jgi:hypothetical protein
VTLLIVVSNGTHKLINCQSISFGFLEGVNAKDFFSDSTGISTTVPEGWSIKQEGATFTATPDTTQAGEIGANGLTFSLSNIKVNTEPGTTDMTITEVTSGQTGTLDYSLAKFPPQFQVSQLTANPVSVNQGESTTLSWNCSPGGVYALQYVDGEGGTVNITETKDGHPLPAVGSYTIDNLQVNPTIFYLIVTLNLTGQNEPLVFDSWFPVTVTIPLVKINSFTASTQTVEYPGDMVTFTWDVTAATQVQLNGVSVAGNSARVPVNETGVFALQAFGQGGPANASILVMVSPVKINSFTPNVTTVYGNNNNVPVTLAWDVQGAKQLLLNNDLVTGQSKSVHVNGTTSFTLEATGYNGPVYAETGVTVKPVNLTISVDGLDISISFNGNPGTYTVQFNANIFFIGTVVPIKATYQIVANNFGVVNFTYTIPLPPQFKAPVISASVNVTGFPSGALTATWVRPH